MLKWTLMHFKQNTYALAWSVIMTHWLDSGIHNFTLHYSLKLWLWYRVTQSLMLSCYGIIIIDIHIGGHKTKWLSHLMYVVYNKCNQKCVFGLRLCLAYESNSINRPGFIAHCKDHYNSLWSRVVSVNCGPLNPVKVFNFVHYMFNRPVLFTCLVLFTY